MNKKTVLCNVRFSIPDYYKNMSVPEASADKQLFFVGAVLFRFSRFSFFVDLLTFI